MDPRRSLTLALAALSTTACAETPPQLAPPLAVIAPTLRPPAAPVVLTEVGAPSLLNCGRGGHHKTRHLRTCRVLKAPAAAPILAKALARPIVKALAVSAALSETSGIVRPAASPAPAAPGPHDHMDGVIKVFAYAPGRLFPVSTAPLRVTTLTLEFGETLIDKAAGDTVRWEIGETTSGSGDAVRTLVMLKPLAAGLSTNLVLTTSKRVYLLDVSSAARRADIAIAWSYPATAPASSSAPASSTTVAATPPSVLLRRVSGRYRIEPVGRRPSWTPAAVFDDGRRTFIAFGPDLSAHAAPLLFVDGADGRPALVNYRQAGDLYVVDALFSRAELRLGERPAGVVRLVRLDGGVS